MPGNDENQVTAHGHRDQPASERPLAGEWPSSEPTTESGNERLRHDAAPELDVGHELKEILVRDHNEWRGGSIVTVQFVVQQLQSQSGDSR